MGVVRLVHHRVRNSTSLRISSQDNHAAVANWTIGLLWGSYELLRLQRHVCREDLEVFFQRAWVLLPIARHAGIFQNRRCHGVEHAIESILHKNVVLETLTEVLLQARQLQGRNERHTFHNQRRLQNLMRRKAQVRTCAWAQMSQGQTLKEARLSVTTRARQNHGRKLYRTMLHTRQKIAGPSAQRRVGIPCGRMHCLRKNP